MDRHVSKNNITIHFISEPATTTECNCDGDSKLCENKTCSCGQGRGCIDGQCVGKVPKLHIIHLPLVQNYNVIATVINHQNIRKC